MTQSALRAWANKAWAFFLDVFYCCVFYLFDELVALLMTFGLAYINLLFLSNGYILITSDKILKNLL